LADDAIRSSEIGETNIKKPILVVASQFAKEIEDRIYRNYNPRHNPNKVPFSREQLLATADGADALFVTPLDRLDSIFFQKVPPTVSSGLWVTKTHWVWLSEPSMKNCRECWKPIADRIEGRPSQVGLFEESLARLERAVGTYEGSEPQPETAERFLAFLSLHRRIESVTISLEKKIENAV
jgi:hypothetical protein